MRDCLVERAGIVEAAPGDIVTEGVLQLLLALDCHDTTLYFSLGALTNLAAALALRPDLASRVRLAQMGPALASAYHRPSPSTTRASTEPPRNPAEAHTTWATLRQQLPGRWIGTTGTRSTPVEYRLMAGNSVLVETFGRPGRETMTTYHADGRGLVATHYCAQGNQPRLRLRAGRPRQLTFVLADVTDKDPDEAVLVELDYDFTTVGGFDRVEVYRQTDGTLERTSWRFAPAPP